MDKKLLLFSLLLTLLSCGREVNISSKQMRENSSRSELVAEQNATLKRGKPDQITVDGTTYPVSIYSSHSALEFIALKPLTTAIPVSYKGTVKKDEMVLESIKAQ